MAPAIEPATRRRGIDLERTRKRAAGPRHVPAGVREHVIEGIPDLARRAKCVQVIAIGEHWPGALEHAIHSASEACGDRFHAASERALVIRFHDQVDVISLERVVDEAERSAFARLGEGAFELAYQPPVRNDGTSLRTLIVMWQGSREAKGWRER